MTSLKIIEELVETLRSFKVSMPEELIEEWKNLILRNSAIIESSEKLEIIKADRDDNKFLETAIAGEADMIVSQDKHLLNLKEYKTIKIMKPEEAISIF